MKDDKSLSFIYSVTDASIEAERRAGGAMSFKLDSSVDFGGGKFQVGVSYKNKNWKITGKIDFLVSIPQSWTNYLAHNRLVL